jgi:prepilin-type N-terminal cleavage/methylation domain-containing protein
MLNLKQMKMKKLNKGESGLTLVELLIVIAITGMIAAAIIGVLFQVLIMNTRTSNRMTAVRQVQNAGFWVSPDVQMANTVNATGTSGFPLILTWTEFTPSANYTHTVTYTLVNIGGPIKLQRTHVNPGLNSTTVTIVAEYISSASFVKVELPSGVAYDFTVTATVPAAGGQSETRLYEIKPRPGT